MGKLQHYRHEDNFIREEMLLLLCSVFAIGVRLFMYGSFNRLASLCVLGKEAQGDELT